MLPSVLLTAFPNLDVDSVTVTHPPDAGYNCVAWAAGVTDAIWWPADPDAYWPPGVQDELTVDALISAMATAGYAPCTDGVRMPGLEKAAVYARDGVPTHVARQLAGGVWSSKLGRDCTVSHATPRGVEGPIYGSAVVFLQRPIP